nr:ThiF family adenylyltransferase [Pantoea sp. 201603H]
MILRTDCNIWAMEDGYYIKGENKSVFLGELSNHQLSVLKAARSSDTSLEGYLSKSIITELYEQDIFVHEVLDFDNDLEKAQSKWFHYHGNNETNWYDFRNLTIGILGCGGIGALASQSLAAAGITNFILIDNDTISHSNLNRQFTYHSCDIGLFKTDILKKRLEIDYPEINITEHKLFISDVEDLVTITSDIDILLCCADKPANTIQKICADFSYRTGKPIIFGAVGFMNGSVGPLIVDKLSASKYKRVCELLEKHQKLALWDLDHASNGATNAIIANMVASEVLQHFISNNDCSTLNKCVNLNFSSLETKILYSIK